MASPIEVLKKASPAKSATPDFMCSVASRIFATRNMLHFAHWDTGSFAKHIALNELYDSIVDGLDEIMEVYQGKYGKVTGFYSEAASMPECICSRVKEEAKWIEDNRTFISKGCTALESLIDDLLVSYTKTIYKLENLH